MVLRGNIFVENCFIFVLFSNFVYVTLWVMSELFCYAAACEKNMAELNNGNV
jgi:hypothetical protein